MTSGLDRTCGFPSDIPLGTASMFFQYEFAADPPASAQESIISSMSIDLGSEFTNLRQILQCTLDL